MYDAESPPEASPWLRRQAIHIVAQLPENREDSLAVLEYANWLVKEFLHRRQARLTLVPSSNEDSPSATRTGSPERSP